MPKEDKGRAFQLERDFFLNPSSYSSQKKKNLIILGKAYDMNSVDKLRLKLERPNSVNFHL